MPAMLRTSPDALAAEGAAGRRIYRSSAFQRKTGTLYEGVGLSETTTLPTVLPLSTAS
ncbi:hypothetical protein FB004_117131 [Sinorhizobium medicae]|nr:hypothetical protein FB004_117131 [Sinorhizobium medicae]TWA21426.1 hypothetical protein FB006_112208 [Sinorhizobium medicae]TWA29916.1 hypothetical protein FB007_118101 [Sinorhizobium medicae]TWA36951.1 hypothetical protein FB009_110200 [Sinorhizobium medicae]TWA41027.1 hypothetical protein FB005_11210 [Sinorhizobium medicae]